MRGFTTIQSSTDVFNPILVMDACLLAGTIILQSGAETHRVEDTMNRMAKACGMRVHSFVTPTAIVFSTDDAQLTKMSRISDRSTDLHKVVQVNEISRQLSAGSLGIEDAYRQLKAIHSANGNYHALVRTLFAAVVSACFLLMYGGTWSGLIPSFVAGGIGYIIVNLVQRWMNLKFFAELIGSLAVGLVATAFVTAGIGHGRDIIIVASVMPLVPGILITNAVRDLMAGHLASGISKGAEAFLTAFAIGAGIAVGIQII